MPKVTIRCAYCGKPKQIFPCRVQEHNYCDRKCKSQSQCSRVLLTCEVCGAEYETVPFWANHPDERRRSKYCSKKCMSVAISKKRRGQGNPQWKPKIQRACVVCGKEFEAHPCIVKNGGAKCCSYKCRSEHFSKTYRGDAHWLYKGGPIDYYGTREWRAIARKIRKRDNYTCQSCGQKWKRGQRALDVHHITPLRDFDDDTKAANQPSNLVALCQSCHSLAENNRYPIQRHLGL